MAKKGRKVKELDVTKKYLESEYKKVYLLSIILAAMLLAVVILFFFGIKLGWFGEPGKIYFSPSEDGYLSCLGNEAICDNAPGTSCQEVTISTAYSSKLDWLCMP